MNPARTPPRPAWYQRHLGPRHQRVLTRPAPAIPPRLATAISSRSITAIRPRSAAAILTALTLLATACGDGTSDAPELAVVRDTVGDTLVVRTLSGRAWPTDAHLEEELSVGALDGAAEYLFGDIGSVALSATGEILILDEQAREVRVFDAGGTYLRTLGGPGEGPGELAQPTAITVLSDGRVVVRDPGNTRLQVYAPDGSRAWEWPVVRGGFITGDPLWRDRDDNVYVLVVLNPEADFGTWKTGLARIGPGGEPLDTLPHPDTGFEEATVQARSERAATMSLVPYSASEHVALHPDGYFVYGVSRSYSFDLLKPEGVLRIQREAEPVPVAAGERDSRRRRIERTMRRLQPGWSWDGPGIPDSKAPYTGFLVAEDGRIWVQRAQPGIEEPNPDFDPAVEGSEPTRWREPVVYDVFGDDGVYFGQVRTPDGFAPRPEPVVRGDTVWAVVRDDLGVQRVVRFRVTFSEEEE